MGDRLYNYFDKMVVMDYSHKMCSYIELNPEKIGFFKSLFSSQKNFPDYFSGQITDLSNVTLDKKGSKHEIKRGANCICKIEGNWSSDISFDGKEYWNIEDDAPLPMMHQKFTLPSDGSFRSDLNNFIKNEQEKSQEEKEKLEVRQRQDRKLRAEYSKNNHN